MQSPLVKMKLKFTLPDFVVALPILQISFYARIGVLKLRQFMFCFEKTDITEIWIFQRGRYNKNDQILIVHIGPYSENFNL